MMFTWLLIGIAALLGYAAGRYRVHQFQNQGEVRVRQAIQQACSGDYWHLLNNVTLPTADGTTQIDHVLVSRYGVFVIETKDYQGWIFGDAHRKQWTQVLYRKKYPFQNPLHQNYKHINAVASALDFLPSEHIRGAVIFVGSAEFKTARPEGVFNLPEFIAFLYRQDTEVMTQNRMQFCVGRLECLRLALTKATDVEHRTRLQQRFGELS